MRSESGRITAVREGRERAIQPPVPAAEFPAGRSTILLVDSVDHNRQYLKGMLKAGPHRILEAKSPEEGLHVLGREPVDLIIADLMMPGIGGLEFCRCVKGNRKTRLIPLLMMTNVQGIENEVAGLESGADEFLIRPLHPTAVRTRVRAMLRNKKAIDSLEEAETILFSLAQTVEARDEETGNHCERLAALSVALGTTLGLPEEELLALYRGGFLHDIGKIAVPDAVLNKGGHLTEQEWQVMKSHTWVGESICRPMKSLAPVLPVIRNHHERWDGSGYPDGLAGEQIPLLARILQVADIFDALTSKRAYKEPYTTGEAVALLQQEAENGWRDGELVSVFCAMVQQPGFTCARGDLLAGVGLAGLGADDEEARKMRESLVRMSREVLR
ncbi:MAG: two-component system response regulator [Candidatus Solibacter sp.]|nr:two-component system response regulator [Candidatus Solibacter sp.]